MKSQWLTDATSNLKIDPFAPLGPLHIVDLIQPQEQFAPLGPPHPPRLVDLIQPQERIHLTLLDLPSLIDTPSRIHPTHALPHILPPLIIAMTLFRDDHRGTKKTGIQ